MHILVAIGLAGEDCYGQWRGAVSTTVGRGPVTATGKVVSGTTTYTTTCSIGRQINNPGFTCGNATVGLAG